MQFKAILSVVHNTGATLRVRARTACLVMPVIVREIGCVSTELWGGPRMARFCRGGGKLEERRGISQYSGAGAKG